MSKKARQDLWCDQKRPCERCQRHGISECYDDTAILQSKEDLRTELQSLRQRQDCTDQLLSAVVEPGLSTQIINHLRAGQSVDTILGWVKEARSSSGALSSCACSPSGGALPSFSEHASRKIVQEPANATAPSEIAINVPGYTFGLEQSLWPRGPPTTAPSPIAWTDISSDTLFINHLLALYFCWEYPIFASLSKEHFMNDYHHGRHRYCSSLLVNSLLALGNRWSHRHDGNTSGDKFFAESVRLLEQETDRRSLTTVRALSAMSMREVSCGRDAGARYYSIQAIRLAIDMGLHRKIREGDLDLYHVQLSTFGGGFSLDSVLSTAVGTLPQYPYRSPLPPKPETIVDVEVASWIPYTDYGAPQQRPNEQMSNVTSAYNCFCQLAEMIHWTLYAMYSPVSFLTGQDLLGVYTRYLSWYENMPESLRLGLNSTPAVLFSHMTYHFAIIHLFRPFLNLQVPGSPISPGNICHEAADAIQGLLKSYSQLYTMHRTPVLVPCFALASAISHLDQLAITAPASPSSNIGLNPAESTTRHDFRALDQDISDLREISACHYSASQALGLLGALAKVLEVKTDIDVANPSPDDYDRLAEPYVGRSGLESARVKANGFSFNGRLGGGFILPRRQSRQMDSRS